MRPLDLGGTGDPSPGRYNPDAIPSAEQVGAIILGLKIATTTRNIITVARGTSATPFSALSLWFQLNDAVASNIVPAYVSSHTVGLATPEYISGDLFL